MKKLFEDDGEWTRESLDLSNQVETVLEGIFKEYMERGFPIRDIAHIMNIAVMGKECELSLKKRLKKVNE